MYFDKEIFLPDIEAVDGLEALHLLAQEFYRKGLVKENYEQGVIEREKNYPTGLLINDVGVAIPHTEPERVIIPQIGVAKLKKPVTFRQMAAESDTVEVSLIFMLAVSVPGEQVEVLQYLMDLFQNRGFTSELLESGSAKEMKATLKKYKLLEM